MSARVLFLHWGPGSHAQLEARLLPRLFPHASWSEVDFWDQPSVAQSTRPFESLVDASIERVRELSANGPIELLGHSVGGLLAAAIAERVPQLISRITLISAARTPPSGFIRFAERVGVDADLIASARNALTPGTFWPIIRAIAQRPDFAAAYWGKRSSATRDMYLEEATKQRPLDLATFQVVMNDLLANPPTLTAGKFTGPVRLWLGDEDPLIDAPAEIREWRAIYPQLQAETMPGCGHFIHFETDPALWRSRA